MVMKLNMVDLKGQYDKIREEVNAEIQKVLDTYLPVGAGGLLS